GDAAAMSGLRQLLTGFPQDLNPGLHRQLDRVAPLEEDLGREAHDTIEDPLIKDREPGQDRSHCWDDDLDAVLPPEEQVLDPRPRSFVDEKRMEPFGGEEFAHRAVVEPHRAVDALVEDRPGEKRAAV